MTEANSAFSYHRSFRLVRNLNSRGFWSRRFTPPQNDNYYYGDPSNGPNLTAPWL